MGITYYNYLSISGRWNFWSGSGEQNLVRRSVRAQPHKKEWKNKKQPLFRYFFALLKDSLPKLHLRVKYFEEKRLSLLPLCILLPPKFINDIRVTRALMGNKKDNQIWVLTIFS